MAHVEFFFDLSSPWTRLAFHNIQPILRETEASVVWRPFLVGGVFNAVNDSVYAGRAAADAPKNRRTFKWLRDWARLSGLPMNFPSAHHPVRSVHAMRLCCLLEPDQAALFRFAETAFDAYYREQRDLDDLGVLTHIADVCGLDGADLALRAQQEPAKARLRANTQEVIDRGGFGSPTIFIDGEDMYFGNDQLPIVRLALQASASG